VENPGWIACCDCVGGHIGNYHAIHSNSCAGTNRDALQNKRAAANGRILTNMDWFNFLGWGWHTRSPLRCVSRMAIGIHEAAATPNPRAVIESYSLVQCYEDVRSHLDPIANGQFRTVEYTSRSNAKGPSKPDVSAQHDMGMTQDDR
jgi:hypothetical protein